MKKVYLYFHNGLFLEAQSFGAEGTAVGEVVFNTSMSGYQEIITDPSYAGQFIVFSMPEIGIVGINDQDNESRSIFCKGAILSHYNDFTSNFRSESTLSQYLVSKGVMGICHIDTRGLIKMITQEGAMMMVASTEFSTKEELKQILETSSSIQDVNYVQEVSTKEAYTHCDSVFDFAHFDYAKPKTHSKILAIDYGAKRNILNELTAAGFEVEVVPHDIKADEILKRFQSKEISGVFLSNGPGDPLLLHDEIAQIKKLVDANIPIFGICLGHQLLAIAHGYETYKLKFGHHGGNHPIFNLQKKEVEITAQNHNYCVPESIAQVATITHRNLFDGTIEGVQYHHKPIFSVQYHPEASPGPKEARTLFAQFAALCRDCAH